MTGPTLETSRLILRPPIAADFDAWASMYAEPETMEHLGGPQTRDGAWRFFATMVGAWALQGYAMFSVVEKESGRWIGRLGPWRPGGESCGWPGPEVGWALRRDAWGKGLALEGASAAIDWAFDQLGWENVIHCIAPANTRSIAVAQRLGSTLQRTGVPLPPPVQATTVDLWGQSKAQWRARAK